MRDWNDKEKFKKLGDRVTEIMLPVVGGRRLRELAVEQSMSDMDLRTLDIWLEN